MSIVITGTPGTGKHTIAGELSQELELEVMDINGIARDLGLLEDDGDVDVARLQDAVRKRMTERCIIVGHLAPYVLDDAVDMVIVLRRSPYELVGVYRERGYSDEKSRENAASEILGVITHDAVGRFGDKVVQVDVTGRDVGDVLARVRSAVSGGIDSEETDWLGMVADNGDLEKFFAD